MRSLLLLAFGLGSFFVAVALGQSGFAGRAKTVARVGPPERDAAVATNAVELWHTERTFEFTVNASIATVAPLFGADRERAWAPDWNPQFVWPAEVHDRQGMVFTVAHGHRTATWVNTCFDLQNGRVQYVYVLPEVLVTVITLRITPEGKRTHVAVAYDRTALNSEANEIVRKMAEDDGHSGPEWGGQINRYLAALPK